ncbi:MAG: phosphotransferase [Microbacteriaceae bacterium]|nr:phosphotransferase [Microbacteriaceae bacterium]
MPAVEKFLSTWITSQRWYAGKGRAPRWNRIGGFTLPDPSGAANIRVELLLDTAKDPVLYQVPLTERVVPLPDAGVALIATLETPEGLRYLYDGPRDPAGAAALLRLLLDERAILPSDGSPGFAARGHRVPTTPALRIVSSRVLAGEQSNTSIIYELETPDGVPAAPIIFKVFRSIHHGENPDVVLPGALAAAGSTAVPTPIGHTIGQWPDSGQGSGFAHGHLAFAQEFLPGVEDAWRVAVRAAEAGIDFAQQAKSLGIATAEVHRTLASVLPTHPASSHDIAAVMASMRARFEQACAQVPAVARHRDAIQSVHSRAETGAWPPMQRVHGDYHLGQVLAVPGRGWVILDFEGEPLRPMIERTGEDSPLRDVAGMLRSLDYVAGAVTRGTPDAAAAVIAREWVRAARNALLEGYRAHANYHLDDFWPLLTAFEIDKAVYEAIYEARNRPDWLEIPVAAIDRLVAPLNGQTH